MLLFFDDVLLAAATIETVSSIIMIPIIDNATISLFIFLLDFAFFEIYLSKNYVYYLR